jgi:hypothetical protein
MMYIIYQTLQRYKHSLLKTVLSLLQNEQTWNTQKTLLWPTVTTI